ncbi:MAG: hypothetical protein CME70_00570 [Halobacteriovorax sp.]|nr:hypothetical protein [Halobacteriovorax sp.]|tara:strand:- start:62940 stop:65042 length:2103 start_codon:yes stop_codon:yes gene_type:complete
MKLFLLLTVLFCSIAQAKSIYIKDSIILRDFYLEVYPSLFGKSDFALEKDFKNLYLDQKRKKRKKINTFLKSTDQFFPAEVLRPLIYWRYINPDQEKLKNVLSYIQMHKLISLRDHIQNPNNSNSLKTLQILRELTGQLDLSSERIATEFLQDIKEKSEIIASIEDDYIFTRSILETKLLVTKLETLSKDIKGYVLDPYGLIPGNQVELLSHNEVGIDRIDWVNERSIFNGGSLDFSKPYMNIENHPVFKDQIFKRMVEMVKRSRESIFIDIFLFGGTMGGAFAKFAIDEALKKEDGFKLLFLHDYATNYNMKEEMMPIFDYIKKRIELEPKVKEKVYLLQANIQRHPPGIPFNLTGLVPKTEEVFNEIEKRNTYYESKIDHSKVLIIDANTDAPEAFFGSKNWTDHSGSYYYDNTLWVKGPAAALIQDSYIEDIEAALTEDKKELSWFFYKELGFDNKTYLPIKEEILENFKIKREEYPVMGDSTLRIAEASVDGKIRNVRNALIELIQEAKTHIYMEQLFLYDPYIVDALILKKKIDSDIKIKILMDNNENFGFNGFPNTMFVKKMKEAGVEIRSRKLHGAIAKFINGTTQTYHQENHRKISSFDGKILMVGSSNLNPDTLQGSFRELGAVVYSPKEARKFEIDFKKDWDDKTQVEYMNIEDYQMKIGENLIDTIWSGIINDLAGTLMRSKDSIERRY